MAQLPGLTTQQVNSPQGTRKQGRKRVERDQTANVSITPQASPGQYYARPGRASKPTQALQVAEALGRLSPTLGKMSQYIADKQRNEAQAQAESEMARMTLDEAQSLVESGEMGEYENPYFQEAFQRQYGVRLGLSHSRELKTQFLSEFNPRTDDVEQFIADNVGSRMDAMASSPLIQQGYSDAIGDSATMLRDAASKQRAEVIEQDKLDGAFEMFDAEISGRLEQASTPEERTAAIDEGYAALRSHYQGNEQLLNLSKGEQDTLVMQVASKYARSGDRDVVEKLLTDDRGGIGSLMDKRGRAGAEAASILATAEKNFGDDQQERFEGQRFAFFDQADRGQLSEAEILQFRQNHPHGISEAQTRSLISRNRSAIEAKRRAYASAQEDLQLIQAKNGRDAELFGTLLDAAEGGNIDLIEAQDVLTETGNTKTLSPEEQEDFFVENYFRTGGLSDRLAEVRGESPEQTFSREVDLLTRNGLVHPQWKRSLANGPTAAHLGTLSEGGELPPSLQRGYELYRRLKAEDPRYLSELVTSSEDEKFYEAMRVAEEYGGLDERQASQAAFQMTQEDHISNNPNIKARWDQIDDAANSVELVKGMFNDIEGASVHNSATLTAELRRAGRFYSAFGGLGVDDALDEAKSVVGSKFSVINGVAVRTAGQGAPTNFKPRVQHRIRRYAETYPEELEARGISPDDISVRARGTGTGSWYLIESETGMPLDNEDLAGFTKHSLDSLEDVTAAQVVTDQRETQRDTQSASEPSRLPRTHPRAIQP